MKVDYFLKMLILSLIIQKFNDYTYLTYLVQGWNKTHYLKT